MNQPDVFGLKFLKQVDAWPVSERHTGQIND